MGNYQKYCCSTMGGNQKFELVDGVLMKPEEEPIDMTPQTMEEDEHFDCD